jgi:hypothetical protein
VNVRGEPGAATRLTRIATSFVDGLRPTAAHGASR